MAPPGPDIAVETVTIPQTSSYSQGLQELSVEIGGDLVIVFTDEGAGRQSEHVLCGGLQDGLNYSCGSQKKPGRVQTEILRAGSKPIDHFAEGTARGFISMHGFPGAHEKAKHGPPSGDGSTPTAPGPHVLENRPDKERAGGSRQQADVRV